MPLQFIDFARYSDLRIKTATPLPRLLAADPLLQTAANVPEIARAFATLKGIVSPGDAALATLYRYQQIKDDAELLLLLNLMTRALAGKTEAIAEVQGESA